MLSVSGDLDVDRTRTLIERHFGDVPARPAPQRPDFDEPDLTAERRESYMDDRAPLPAIASAWRVPDPIADFDGYLPYVVLAEVLTDGDASRLVRRLIQQDRIATSVGGYIGFMGEAFEVRDPTALLLQTHLPPAGDVDKVLRTIDEECDRLATDGLEKGELARTQARMATHMLRETDPVLGRALRMAVLEQQRGDASVMNDLPHLIGAVTEEQVDRRGRRAAPGAPRVRRGQGGYDEMTSTPIRALPDLEPNRKLTLPKSAERTLANGLTVIAIRRPSVPLIEMRLRIPFAKANLARGDVLSADAVLRHRDDVSRRHRRRPADGRRRTVGERRPGPADASPATRWSPACRGCWRSSPTCWLRRRTRPTRWAPSGIGWPTGSRWR